MGFVLFSSPKASKSSLSDSPLVSPNWVKSSKRKPKKKPISRPNLGSGHLEKATLGRPILGGSPAKTFF